MVEYRVTYREAGTAESEWLIERDGATVDLSRKKDMAVSLARSAAKDDADEYGETVELVVERQDGSVQDRFSYGGEGSGNGGFNVPGL